MFTRLLVPTNKEALKHPLKTKTRILNKLGMKQKPKSSGKGRKRMSTLTIMKLLKLYPTAKDLKRWLRS